MVIPPTIIVRHPRERPAKCTIWPLREHPGLVFIDYPPASIPDLENYIRLDPEGPPLAHDDSACGLLILDGSWRWTATMTKMFACVPPRSLAGYRTAYPRVSKLFVDPEGGLATVEALFLAHHILGRPTAGVLNHYRWKGEFLKANGVKLPEPEA